MTSLIQFTKSLLVLSILMTTLHSFAFGVGNECTKFEAQFFGVVTRAEDVAVDQSVYECYIQIKFDLSKYTPAISCGLSDAAVDQIYAGPFKCEDHFKVGQYFGGYLVQDIHGYTSLD